MKKAARQTALVRSSAAEYLTFVAASGAGGAEAVHADENIWLTEKMMARQLMGRRLESGEGPSS